jgi:hypothetical protein
VKEFLSQKGIAYGERDNWRDEQALDELSKLGYMTTPVIRRAVRQPFVGKDVGDQEATSRPEPGKPDGTTSGGVAQRVHEAGVRETFLPEDATIAEAAGSTVGTRLVAGPRE